MNELDFTTQNTINHYRHKLQDIHQWHQQLNDTMTTITSRNMNLAGPTPTTTPHLPGGDALAMLAPYSDGNTEPDNLPHPAQIIIEGAHLIDKWQHHTKRTYTFTEAIHRNHQALPWLHKHGHLNTWAQDINQLWHRLGTITGNIKPEPPQTWTGNLTDYTNHIPNNTMLTPTQAEHFWPGIANRIKTQRHRRTTTLPNPDHKGRYPAHALKQFHQTKKHAR